MGESKWQVAIKSAGRSLVPLLVAFATLTATGVIKNWHDLLDVKVVGALIAGVVAKGAVTAATAKSVSVEA